VAQFLSSSLYLSARDLAVIPQFFSAREYFVDLIPIYKAMGENLVAMHDVEKNLAESNKFLYARILNPTIASGEELRGSASTSESNENRKREGHPASMQREQKRRKVMDGFGVEQRWQ